MRKHFALAMLIVSFVVCGLSVQNVSATSPNIVISQVKAGNSSTSRLVEIYNNSNMPVDVTGWCVYYGAPSATTPPTSLGCFVDPNPSVHVFLDGHSFALLASVQTGLTADLVLTAGLGNGTSGHVYLMNNLDEVDRVGWGDAVNAEGGQPIILDATKVIERKQSVVEDILIDTDNNQNDFMNSVLRSTYQYGSLYEIVDVCQNIDDIQETIPTDHTVDQAGNCLPPPVDMCANMDGLQPTLPSGYELDENGACLPDVCSNIAGLQLTLPPGKEFDVAGNCVDHDICLNLGGVQVTLPPSYKLVGEDVCLLDLSPVLITELLPNAHGSDDGHEFIELYNPNDTVVDLTLYLLVVGSGTTKSYTFPAGSTIAPKSYQAFSNDDINFTLVNSSGQATLTGADGSLIDQSPVYDQPGDGMAWALLSGVWDYTNQPTPGAGNQSSIVMDDGVEEEATGLKPCAPNQYRNLETNRCRLLVTVGSTLLPCKDGQYRSETTNRCRSIASDAGSLAACNANQERNPETNRCRLIASTQTGLTACKAGQERNPDTNRCRNVAGSVPEAAFAVEAIGDSAGAVIGWWALGGIGVIALAYAGWEWRIEIIQATKKLRSFLHHTK